MTSYAFFFSADTFGSIHQRMRAGQSVPIDYVAFDDKQPCNGFKAGDELFIVGLRDYRVLLAGRLVVAGPAMPRADAVARTGKADLLNKPLVCLADAEQIDAFRPELRVPADIAAGLELFKIGGESTDTSSLRAGRPDPNLFRACPRLSDASAAQLRQLLDLPPKTTTGDDETEEVPEGQDDEEYRLQSIKTRRGQRRFRQALLAAYKGRCVVTGCRVEDLLEAAHITPHAEHTDYRVSNGLLLRADIHTLFDLNLLVIDEYYRIKVSERLRHSEYWTYNGRTLDRFPDLSADQPSRDALAARAARCR